jgi:hypothetical protein
MKKLSFFVLVLACVFGLVSCGNLTPVAVAGSKGTTLFFPVIGD